MFVPLIVYMFAKGMVLAVTDGYGMVQTIAQLVVEGLMLLFLLFSRPYERRSGNIINIVIQVVRALSVICVLVFVEGMSSHPLHSNQACGSHAFQNLELPKQHRRLQA